MSTALCCTKAQPSMVSQRGFAFVSIHQTAAPLMQVNQHAHRTIYQRAGSFACCAVRQGHHPPLLCISGRRSAKLISVIVSAFTASFVQSWGAFFPDQPLKGLPIFDARTVCYPTDAILRDYLSWRQADTHINKQVCRVCHCISVQHQNALEVMLHVLHLLVLHRSQACQAVCLEHSIEHACRSLTYCRCSAVQHLLLDIDSARWQDSSRGPKAAEGIAAPVDLGHLFDFKHPRSHSVTRLAALKCLLCKPFAVMIN